MSISLLVPWYGGNPIPLQRTKDSCNGIAEEMVAIHQKLFDDDSEVVSKIADKVVEVPWNSVFKLGFGELTNLGLPACSGQWILWLGTGETVAEEFLPIRSTLESWTNPKTTFFCNHVNDPNQWRRIFNKNHCRVGGLIHEDVKGEDGPLMFRMQDTEKEPHPDPFRNEVLKWVKTCSYNWNYLQLLQNPYKLSYTNAGWLEFVRGARESIEGFCSENKDLIDATKSGDRDAFLSGVKQRLYHKEGGHNINFNPQGQPMSEGAL